MASDPTFSAWYKAFCTEFNRTPTQEDVWQAGRNWERGLGVDAGAHRDPVGAASESIVTREALVDLIAAGLGDTYHCTRVWDAWNVGTMGQEDFEPVDESDTPGEIADAALALLATQATTQAEPLAWIKSSELANARLRGGSINAWLRPYEDCDMAIYAEPQAARDAQTPPSVPSMPDYWSVLVTENAETVVSIGQDWLSGKRNLDERDEQTIIGAAQHLLSFVGYGLPPSKFDPDADSQGKDAPHG